MAVQRATAQASAAGDLVERYQQTLGGGRVSSGAEQLITVAACVGAQRLGVLGYYVGPFGNPDVVIAEYTMHGRMVAAGSLFTMSFAMVLTIKDGRIVHSRDYSDPIAGAGLLGRLPELATALAQECQVAGNW